MGYTALWAGLVLGPGGVSSFIVYAHGSNPDAQGSEGEYLLILGWPRTAYAQWMMSHFSLQADFYSIAWPRFVQGFGLGLFSFPSPPRVRQYFNGKNRKMPPESSTSCETWGAVSGRLQRNRPFPARAGSSDFSFGKFTPYNPAFQAAYQGAAEFLQKKPSTAAPSTGGLAFLYQEVLARPSMLSFNDTFLCLR